MSLEILMGRYKFRFNERHIFYKNILLLWYGFGKVTSRFGQDYLICVWKKNADNVSWRLLRFK